MSIEQAAVLTERVSALHKLGMETIHPCDHQGVFEFAFLMTLLKVEVRIITKLSTDEADPLKRSLEDRLSEAESALAKLTEESGSC